MFSSLMHALPGVGASAVAPVLALAASRHLPSVLACSRRHQQDMAGPSAAASPPQHQATAQVGRLNHVAVAVPDLDKAAERWRCVMGAKVSAPQPVPAHGVTVVFVELPNTKIELLHPLGESSPIAGFLARNPAGGIHHMCLEVEDVRASMGALRATSVRVLSAAPQVGAHGNEVVFLHPKDCDGVLVELEQVPAAQGAAQGEGEAGQQPAGGS